MVNRNYGTADETMSGTVQTIHDEESPLLPSPETSISKVKPLVGVGTIIAVLLLGTRRRFPISRQYPNIFRRIHL